MDVFTTDCGVSVFGLPTGETRTIPTANMFGGPSSRTLVEIEAFEIVHPDDVPFFPGMETAAAPEWISSRPCGVGKPRGKEWV